MMPPSGSSAGNMKSILLLFAASTFAIAFLPSCQTYRPGDGWRYGNEHPNQHGRWKAGYRTHAEKKYMRPR